MDYIWGYVLFHLYSKTETLEDLLEYADVSFAVEVVSNHSVPSLMKVSFYVSKYFNHLHLKFMLFLLSASVKENENILRVNSTLR